jgi:universal stress protein E
MSSMNTRLRRILLAVREPLRVPAPIMRKVSALCRSSGATLELFHATELGVVAAIEKQRRELDRMARSALLDGIRVTTCVSEDRPPHEAVVRRVLAERIDLVIATTHSHPLGARLFLRNTDWELIRYCPCPLLLLKSGRPYAKGSILVAVDPFHTHAKPAKLDGELLTAGAALGRLLSRPVHAFHAYMPLIANVEGGSLGEPVLWEDPEVERIHEKQVKREFDRLLERRGIPPARRHLQLGDVADELQATAKSIKAGIVVMGAVSRSGLSRLFIGSTAERALDRLACDVLIIKPHGFKTAIPRRAVRR